MSFRLEYKRGSASGSSTPSSMFQRQVKMQVDISHISKAESGPEALYAITFTLLSGKSLFLLFALDRNKSKNKTISRFFTLGNMTSSCLAAYKDRPFAGQDKVILPYTPLEKMGQSKKNCTEMP